MVKDMAIYLTKQMTAKKGLKRFGKNGAAAIKKELEQVVYRKVMHSKHAKSLSRNKKRATLRYLMFLKQKRSGLLNYYCN